jgi:signal peptidase I
MDGKDQRATAPGFTISKKGYSPRDVDEYIDSITLEHAQTCNKYQEYIHALEAKAEPSLAAVAPSVNSAEPICGVVEPSLAAAELSTGVAEPSPDETSKSPAKRKSLLGDVLFYVGLVVVLVLIVSVYGGGSGAPRSIAGYSAMRVLTSSMQDAIPKDSLVIMREVEPGTLAVGDDITFLKDAETTVTHRIVGIQENYANTGARGFQTQGIMNAVPDKEMVAAQNVIGKVVFCSLPLGQIVGFIKDHALWVGLFTVLLIGLVSALRVVFAKEEPAKEQQQSPLVQVQQALPLAQVQPVLPAVQPVQVQPVVQPEPQPLPAPQPLLQPEPQPLPRPTLQPTPLQPQPQPQPLQPQPLQPTPQFIPAQPQPQPQPQFTLTQQPAVQLTPIQHPPPQLSLAPQPLVQATRIQLIPQPPPQATWIQLIPQPLQPALPQFYPLYPLQTPQPLLARMP